MLEICEEIEDSPWSVLLLPFQIEKELLQAEKTSRANTLINNTGTTSTTM